MVQQAGMSVLEPGHCWRSVLAAGTQVEQHNRSEGKDSGHRCLVVGARRNSDGFHFSVKVISWQ